MVALWLTKGMTVDIQFGPAELVVEISEMGKRRHARRDSRLDSPAIAC
jgi:hypothetical protein